MNRTVLIIEDDVEIIRYILQEVGFTLVEGTVENYYEEVKKYLPDVILLDYWIGNTFGSKICMNLKAHPDTADIPIILTPAVANIDLIAVDCCAKDSLAKPFDIEDLEDKNTQVV